MEQPKESSNAGATSPIETDPAQKLLTEQSEYLKYIAGKHSFFQVFLRGVVQGLGTVVGATLVVSLLIALLKPLSQFEAIEPLLTRIAEALESSKR